MPAPDGRRCATCCFVGATAFAIVATAWAIDTRAVQPGRPSSPAVRLYSDNPANLWNRLHATLFVRVAADGREYGADRVDPLLWASSTYLLQGSTHTKAVALIDEFIDTHGERLIHDPLKRAILQRDLWEIFDWLEADRAPYQQPPLTPAAIRKSADELCKPLAMVIARLALTPAEIRSLPDNYAAAARVDALPPDLFAPEGPGGRRSIGRPYCGPTSG
jgi:hypothetical protein